MIRAARHTVRQCALAAIICATTSTATAQTVPADDEPPTPLQAMFTACLAPDVTGDTRATAVQAAGWRAAPETPETQRAVVEQLTLRTDRGDPARPWGQVLTTATERASSMTDTAGLFILEGEVPSLLMIETDPLSGTLTCGYSASDSTREALELLLGVGREPSQPSAGTMTIRAALTVRAIVTDDLGRRWQVAASSYFADPADIIAETGAPFSTAFALTIALTPAES